MLLKRLLTPGLSILALGMLLTATVSAEDFLLNDNNQNATHNCEGGKALINGNHNNIKLQECLLVQINGNDNVIEALHPTHLEISGNRNDIAWTRKSDKDKAPTIANVGTSNNIQEKKQ